MPHYATSAPADTAVLTDQFLAALYRSTPDEARDLSLQLPLPMRAQLALFCNARLHLRPIGRAIATACTEASLINEAGAAGRTLFAQAAAAAAICDKPAGPGKRIALATSAYGGYSADDSAFADADEDDFEAALT
jgi:hypothetical protein